MYLDGRELDIESIQRLVRW